MSARTKLLLPFAALMVAVLTVMHFVIFDLLKQRLIADKEQSEHQGLKMVALAIAPDLLANDFAKIHETLTDVWTERLWWRTLTLHRPDGRLLYPLSEIAIPPSTTRLTVPVIAGNRELATLSIASDINYSIAQSLDVLVHMEITVTVLLLLGAGLVVHLQARWVLTPLAGLMRAAKAVAAGQAAMRLPHAGGEVGQLVDAFAGMAQSISQREAALRNSESRLTAVIDNSGEAVVTLDAQGTILSCNKAAMSIFGYEQDELPGKHLDLLVPHHDCVPTPEEGTETVGRKADGSQIALWLILTQIRVNDGQLFVATISDITSRKQAETELRESESRFRDLAGSASDWFWETDANNCLTFVSERIGAVLGVKPSAILGFSYLELGLGDGDQAVVQAHLTTLQAHAPFRDVVFPVGPLGGKDGRYIRISGIPMVDIHGDFLGYRGVGADITREVLAERQAQQARQQLADAIESISDSIAVYDAQDRLVLFNSEYQRMFAPLGDVLSAGNTFEQVLASPQAQRLFDTDGLPYSQWRRQRLELHQAATGESLVQRLRDGRWLLAREYRTAEGGVVAVRTDITLLKEREEALDRLQRRYQLILDSAGDGIIGLDTKGRVSFANRAAADLVGLAGDTLIGADYRMVVDSDNDDTPVHRSYAAGLAQKVDDAFFKHADGHLIQVEYLVAPIFEQEQVMGAVLVFRDVALRRLYEHTLAEQQQILERQVAERTAELAASRQRLQAITENLFEGVLVVDQGGMVTFANSSAHAALGCQIIENLPLDQVLRLDGLDFSQSALPTVMRDGVPLSQDDSIFATPDGRRLNVAVACSPLRQSGECVGAVISFRDIRQLKDAQQEALQASRLASVGQLAAGIAHEINTPIQYVGDNLRFVRDSVADMTKVLDQARDLLSTTAVFSDAWEKADIDYLKDELPSALKQSLDGVAQVSRIVLSMKEFSHPGSTGKAMTDINRALDSTLTVSRNTWKQVARVETDFAPDLPLVHCHGGEINQVFLNLIVNAAHAIEASGKPLPGTIRVTTRHQDGFVRIGVKDSGTGISPTIMEKIFDPFFTTKSVGKGTGQGLAICLDVVKIKHGGKLEVNGNEGEGAEFVVTLPIDTPAEAGHDD
ncbi:MAG: PAS domain S-box protein [Magnetospirillum sp.]